VRDPEKTPQPQVGDSERNLEWELPASLATKEAITRVADHLVPIAEHDVLHNFESRSGNILDIGQYPPLSGNKSNWFMIYEPDQGVSQEGEAYMVDENRVAQREDGSRGISYFLHITTQGEISLEKFQWGTEESRHMEVSEGEAKWLFDEMAGAQERWPDAYRSRVAESDHSEEP
jgi:hypothetical protein